MRFDTGIHPRQWHRGAWLLAIVSAALVLLLTHRPTGGLAFAMEPDPVPPIQESPPPSEAVTPPATESVAPSEEAPALAPPAEGTAPTEGAAPEAAPAPAQGSGAGYVAEILDKSYTVGPAEFMALDLPMIQNGARAVHLLGTVTTKGKKDIVVRLFRAADYDRWLKQKSARKQPQAFWTSPRSGNITLDQDLPSGQPVVMLLDNGYSIRTPKKVTCQLQLRYERGGTETFDTEGGKIAGSAPSAPKVEDNLPTPRSNTDMELPPPPPPPPSGY